MKPLVKDWVQTLGMSRSLARSLRLPLDLPLEEFLEDLPEEQKDEAVEQKLHRFLSKRDDEAMVHDPAVHRRERARFMMFGKGSSESGRLVDKMLGTPLELAAEMPSWRDDYATPKYVTERKAKRDRKEAEEAGEDVPKAKKHKGKRRMLGAVGEAVGGLAKDMVYDAASSVANTAA